MTEPMPLTPPAEAMLTLTAPEPAKPVVATQAPKIAPAVDPAVAPQLDQKVEGYLSSLMTVAPHSPEFSARAEDVGTMGDQDIRKAAETSNRLLKTPVKALNEGGADIVKAVDA